MVARRIRALFALVGLTTSLAACELHPRRDGEAAPPPYARPQVAPGSGAPAATAPIPETAPSAGADNAAVAPTTPPPGAPAADPAGPPLGGIRCDELIAKILEVAAAEAPPELLAQFEQARARLTAACNAEPWSAAARTCFMNAKTSADSEVCRTLIAGG